MWAHYGPGEGKKSLKPDARRNPPPRPADVDGPHDAGRLFVDTDILSAAEATEHLFAPAEAGTSTRIRPDSIEVLAWGGRVASANR